LFIQVFSGERSTLSGLGDRFGQAFGLFLLRKSLM